MNLKKEMKKERKKENKAQLSAQVIQVCWLLQPEWSQRFTQRSICQGSPDSRDSMKRMVIDPSSLRSGD